MRTRHSLAFATLTFLMGLVEAADAGVVFYDGFESGMTAWTKTGAWGTTTIGPHDGTQSLTDTPSTNYSANAGTTVRTGPVDLSGATAPRLIFWLRFSSEQFHDYLHVETSKDGTNWQTQDTYSGSQTTWRRIDSTLPGYVNAPAAYFRFRVQTDAIIHNDGWYVDDFMVIDGNPSIVFTAPVTGAAWQGNSNHSVTWTYDGSFGPHATSMELRYSDDNILFYLLQDSLALDVMSYSWLVPAINTTQARVRMEIFDKFGEVLESTRSGQFTIDSTAPGTVSLSSPATGACGSGTPAFDWNDATGAANYTLTVTPTNGSPLVKTGLTSSTYTLSSGEALSSANNPHSWTVTALDAAGNSTSSTARSYVADSTPPEAFALSSPADQTVAAAAGLAFTWQASSDTGCGLAKYRLHIDGNLCADDIAPGDTTIALAATTCASLANGEHAWTVSAVDAAGNSTWSSASPGGSGGYRFTIPGPVPEAGAPDSGAGGSNNDASTGSGGGSGSGSGGGSGSGNGGVSGSGSGGVSGSGSGGVSGSGSGGVGGSGSGGVGGGAGTGGAITASTGGRVSSAGGRTGSSGSAGEATDAGVGGPRASAGDDGGCGCRTSPRTSSGALASLVALVLIGFRRRRSSQSSVPRPR